jgi:hypothetical protein
MPMTHGGNLAKNASTELPGDNDPALGIDAVDLKHLLCKVEPDGGNC